MILVKGSTNDNHIILVKGSTNDSSGDQEIYKSDRAETLNLSKQLVLTVGLLILTARSRPSRHGGTHRHFPACL